MSTAPHVHAQLSAFLDEALGSADRRAVESHLAGCAQCRARLAELRATASLIASLPDPVPSRRLVPRLAAPPMWLAPLRTLATLASGLSVFLFIASSFLAGAGQLASGTAAAPAAAPAAGRADTTVLASGAARSATTPAPLGPNVGAASASPDISASDSTKAVSPTSAPSAFAAVPAPTSDPNAAAQAAAESASRDQAVRATNSHSLGPSPWVWLALAIMTGALALALQRRLRSS